jgi:5-methylcytosine-specific restriction endonuclease McrA
MTDTKKSDPFYSCARWRKLRFKILERDGYTCVACNYKGESRDLQVDHILPRLQFPQVQWREVNLRTLCRTCHTQIGTSMGRGGKATKIKLKPVIGEDGFPVDNPEWSGE